jgi:hypothetical protein
VVITGSRIQKANLVSSSPVTQVDAEDLLFQGTVRVEDMLRNLPQVYSDQNTSQSNGATGTATINLRNLGPERTLVLINGRRMPAGSPLQGGRGNVTAYATYRNIDPVLQSRGDYSSCALSNDASTCFGSSTIPQGRFTVFGATADPFDFIVQGNEFVDHQGETYISSMLERALPAADELNRRVVNVGFLR